MRGPKYALSTAAALHRVFIAPIECSRALPTRQLPAVRALTNRHANIRRLSSTALPTAKGRLPRDNEIQDQMVRLVLEDNTLSPPQYTSRVLNSIDRQNEMLVMVAQPNRDADSDSTQAYPVCKILSKKAVREAEKSRQKKKKNELPVATVKTIELNWAIDPHDLGHRLQRVKDFLNKGWRVDVVMAGKKRSRRATPEEMKVLVARVREVMKEVEGAKEWRGMEGALGGVATVFLEGKVSEKDSAL